jgi:uncharacterized membrane protein
LLWQYSQFVRGYYGFHDLTLITDFFTNALYHGRPFWITDYEISHLTIHFTPTLLLLIPAFALFKSQFALIALVSMAIAIAVFVLAREQFDALQCAKVPTAYRIALTATLFVLAAFNRYTLRCLASAHFEPLYILPATLVLAAVRRGTKLRWLLLACLVALGVRQDTGLFLFFLLVSCLLAPASWNRLHRGRVCVAAICCVLYIVLATKLLMPWFGSTVSTRMWQKWGETWPEVFMAWYNEPQLVYKAIGDSDFVAFNAQFGFLQVLPGLAWLLNQLPSILFFTAETWDKQRLAYYNTSCLLPGIFLCLAFAQLHAVEFIRRITKPSQRWRHAGFAAIAAMFLYASFSSAFLSERDDDHVLAVDELTRTDVFTKQPLRRLLACSQVKSVASDFYTIVFAPLSIDKYVPTHARKADVVVALHKDNRNIPYAVRPKDLRRELIDNAGYHLAFNVDGYDVFVAPRVKCLDADKEL